MTDTEALARLITCFWFNEAEDGYEWSFIEGHTVKDEDHELNEFLKKFVAEHKLKV